MYVNNKFVKPVNINSAIKGTLVELHFELHHFPIWKVVQDSFNATIEQMIILCPSEAHPMTAYKRKNLCVGPILAQLTLLPQNQMGEGSCTGKVDDSTADKENDGLSMSVKSRWQKVDDGTKLSMSEKRHGKQKVKELEDEVEEQVEK